MKLTIEDVKLVWLCSKIRWSKLCHDVNSPLVLLVSCDGNDFTFNITNIFGQTNLVFIRHIIRVDYDSVNCTIFVNNAKGQFSFTLVKDEDCLHIHARTVRINGQERG